MQLEYWIEQEEGMNKWAIVGAPVQAMYLAQLSLSLVERQEVQ